MDLKRFFRQFCWNNFEHGGSREVLIDVSESGFHFSSKEVGKKISDTFQKILREFNH